MNHNSDHVALTVSELRLLREVRAAFFRTLLCKPSSGEIQLANQALGNLSIQCQRVDYVSGTDVCPTSVDAFETMPITDGGWIHVESHFATTIVSSLLGMPSPILPRKLSRIERGVMGGVVASILNDLGIFGGLDLQNSEPFSRYQSNGGFLFNFQVRTNGVSGTVQCYLSQSALDATWQNGYLASLFLSRTIPVSLELARTALSHADLLVLSVGDAIVFDDVPPLLESRPWPVSLGLIDSEIPAILSPDGSLCLGTSIANSFDSQSDPCRDVTFFHADKCQLPDDPTAFVPPAEDTRVDFIVEAATPPLASDSLWSLLEGETISLGVPRNTRVLVRAGKLAPVKGELISVDGFLGVRMLQKWRALPLIDQTTLPLSTI